VAEVNSDELGIVGIFYNLDERKKRIDLCNPEFRKTFDSCRSDGRISVPGGRLAQITKVEYTDIDFRVTSFDVQEFLMLGRPLKIKRTGTTTYEPI